MIKGSIQEENTTILSIYAPNIGAPKYIKQVLTNIREKLTVTIKVGTFDTSLITLDRSSRQKNQWGNIGLKWHITPDGYTLLSIYLDTDMHASVAQLHPILCNPMDHSPPGSSVCGISQARILEWVTIFLFWGIFPTQPLNLCLLYCRQILYLLRHHRIPYINELFKKASKKWKFRSRWLHKWILPNI